MTFCTKVVIFLAVLKATATLFFVNFYILSFCSKIKGITSVSNK